MARPRNNKWQADAVVDGKRVRPTFNTKEEAEAFERNAEHMASLSEASVGTLFPQLATILWSKTKDYKGALSITNDLVRRLGPSTLVYKITDETIDALVEGLDDEGLANQTINNKLTRLSKLLKRAKRKKLITSMPVIELRKQAKGRIRFLSVEEEKSLFSHMSEGDHHFCRFLLYTGCRYGEAVRFEWRDASNDTLTFWVTKSGQPRSVPMTQPVREALEWAKTRHHNQPGPFAWVSYTAFRQRWQTARKHAGLAHDDQVIPHVLRHTCASRLVQKGVDIRKVRDWLGHASINTTMRYAHLAPKDLVDAARLLEAA